MEKQIQIDTIISHIIPRHPQIMRQNSRFSAHLRPAAKAHPSLLRQQTVSYCETSLRRLEGKGKPPKGGTARKYAHRSSGMARLAIRHLAIRHLIVAVAATALLAACQEGKGPLAAKSPPNAPGAIASGPIPTDGKNPATVKDAPASARSVKLVDRDVEAPEIFQTNDLALWDGRPSLGGVWVASPDAKDPERVILRNTANGKFVIGALFRRERDNPGPTLQISSDAAAALGLLAGAPGKISVTALRREEAASSAPDASKPLLDTSETVATETLDPIPGAAAAIDRAATKPNKGAKPTAPQIATIAPENAPAAKPAAPATPKATGKGGLIQIGIFSVEANAKRAADTLKAAGIAVDTRSESSQGKALWSVTARGDKAVLAKIKQAGFKDAYFLKG
jgi:cell division septation protein DedD